MEKKIEQKKAEFEQIVKPVMKWLAENQHPHMKIIIESNCAEMVEGTTVCNTNEFIVD